MQKKKKGRRNQGRFFLFFLAPWTGAEYSASEEVGPRRRGGRQLRTGTGGTRNELFFLFFSFNYKKIETNFSLPKANPPMKQYRST